MTVIDVLELPVATLCQSERCLSPAQFVFIALNRSSKEAPPRWLCGWHRDELVQGAALLAGTGVRQR